MLLNEKKAAVEFDSFESFYQDPIAKEILEKVSLEYLKTHDTESFEREFTGELDNEGYFLRKDGENPTIKPSMNIDGGEAMEWVVKKVNEELKKNG